MGLFRKKKVTKKEPTFTEAYEKALVAEKERVASFKRMTPRLDKFIAVYGKYFNNHVQVYRDYVQMSFGKKFSECSREIFPDGFYSTADKLGLNIEPICYNGMQFNISEETYNTRSFNVRAKSK